MRSDLQQQFLTGYDEHSQALFRYCYFKVSDREVAKDLVQDTFAKTWTFMTGGGDIENMRAFLYRTASNLVIDHYRRHKTSSLDALAEAGFDPGEDDTQRWGDRLDGERALQLLEKIPEIYRDAVYMRYVDNLPVKDIAEMLGESENTISVRLHRGLEKIKTLFNHEE